MLLGSKLIAYWLGVMSLSSSAPSACKMDGIPALSCLGAPSIASRSVDQSVKVIEV